MDPDTRTTPVRIVTRNPGDLLKKDMYLEAVIHTKTDKSVLSVPVSAVLHDSENEPFVYVEVQPRRIRAAIGSCGRAAERLCGDTERAESRRRSGFGRQRVSAVRQQLSIGPSGMISRLVSFALSQRFLIVIASLALMIWGAIAFQRLPIDAYPDLSPPHVEIITQWPGHAAEEVERLITIPIEIEMNGIPRLESLRSISLYGLSSVQMNFEYGADPYFAREQAFERVANATMPQGVTPSLSPLYSPSGLIYRYVLQSPDRTPQELKTIEDWLLERAYRSIPGVADDSGFGGTTMQYQVLLDPNKLLTYGISVAQVQQQLSANNANAGGGFYSQGGQIYYIRGLGLVRDTADIGNIVLAMHNGIPVYVRDVAKVQIGHAVRLGQFGYMRQEEAVEGVILMRVGEQAQVILKRVEEKTDDLNRHVLPRDVEGGSLLRPQLFDRGDDPHRGTESRARHDSRAGDPRFDAFQRAYRADRGGDDSVRVAVRLYLPRPQSNSGESAVDRGHRFRDHRRRRRGDGGEYFPRVGGTARPEL